MALQYNFIDNNYTIYTPTEEPVVSKTNYLKLLGDIGEISGIRGQLSNGILLAEDNSSKMIVNNSPEDDGSNFRNNYLTGEIQEDPYRPWQNYSKLKYTNDELSKMSFEELIKKESLPIHITSGYRKNARTTSGKPSNHSFKDERGFSMAYDIKPAEGHSWKELEHVIYEDPTVTAWFKAHNWGILEEMYKDKRPGFYDVRGDYHFTKASGPHFHVGPDRYGVEWYNSKVKIPVKQTTTLSSSKEKNVKLAYTYLINNGIPKGSAAGIVGNLYCENLKNPTQTVKDSRNTIAYGIAGFNSEGELPNLQKWSKVEKPDFYKQLDFIIDVIKTRPKLQVLLDESMSPEEASFIWGRDFEKFAGKNGVGYKNQNDPEHQKRASISKTIFEKYGK